MQENLEIDHGNRSLTADEDGHYVYTRRFIYRAEDERIFRLTNFFQERSLKCILSAYI